MRLSKLLWRKYTLGISPNTIKAILRRYGIGRKKRKVRRGSRPLYDYERLLSFEEWHRFALWFFKSLWALCTRWLRRAFGESYKFGLKNEAKRSL